MGQETKDETELDCVTMLAVSVVTSPVSGTNNFVLAMCKMTSESDPYHCWYRLPILVIERMRF